MEQDNILKTPRPKPTTTKKAPRKNDYSTVRFNRDFMKKVSKLVDRANKKSFGRKIKPGMILESLFSLSDEKLLEKAIKKAQENSLSLNDKREVFFKERLTKFNGSKEQMELKMMEIFDQYLSENQS